jgi:hypothetical protein
VGGAVPMLRKAHSWLMVYHLQFYPHNISFLSGLWEKQFQQTVQNFTGQHITITYFHSQVHHFKKTLNNSKSPYADPCRGIKAKCRLLGPSICDLCLPL